VKEKFKQSETNKFKFPKENIRDSESSLKSLEGIEKYDLEKQNDNRVLDDDEKLVEMIFELREIGKDRVYKLLE
jgi:hypothetical protein